MFHVDELILSGMREEDIKTFQSQNQPVWKTKDLGKSRQLLVIKLKWTKHTEVSFEHMTLIEYLLNEYDMESYNPIESQLILTLVIKNENGRT